MAVVSPPAPQQEGFFAETEKRQKLYFRRFGQDNKFGFFRCEEHTPTKFDPVPGFKFATRALIDWAVAVLGSKWAQELAPEQAVPVRRLAKGETGDQMAAEVRACLKGRSALDPSLRKVLVERKVLRRGSISIEFDRTGTTDGRWVFLDQRTGPGQPITMCGELAADLAAAVLRDQLVSQYDGRFYIAALPCRDIQVWERNVLAHPEFGWEDPSGKPKVIAAQTKPAASEPQRPPASAERSSMSENIDPRLKLVALGDEFKRALEAATGTDEFQRQTVLMGLSHLLKPIREQVPGTPPPISFGAQPTPSVDVADARRKARREVMDLGESFKRDLRAEFQRTNEELAHREQALNEREMKIETDQLELDVKLGDLKRERERLGLDSQTFADLQRDAENQLAEREQSIKAKEAEIASARADLETRKKQFAEEATGFEAKRAELLELQRKIGEQLVEIAIKRSKSP